MAWRVVCRGRHPGASWRRSRPRLSVEPGGFRSLAFDGAEAKLPGACLERSHLFLAQSQSRLDTGAMGAFPNKAAARAHIAKEEEEKRKFHEHQMAVLQELDRGTKVPHLLIEFRSPGFFEICGKDLGGIYGKLDAFLKETFGCEECTLAMKSYPSCCCFKWYEIGQRPLPREPWDDLCDRIYICGQMVSNGMVKSKDGFQFDWNFGKKSMQIVDFMTNTCGWGFQLCDGSNFGRYGSHKEQQLKFRAPHPLNFIAPHIMIELRHVGAGSIKVSGRNEDGIHGKLAAWFTKTWDAKQLANQDLRFCDMTFNVKCFKRRGVQGENNLGLRTMQVVDFMTRECSWTLLTCNSHNSGWTGEEREQQLVFRKDHHLQQGQQHIMVEYRDFGFIEVNGLHDAGDIGAKLDGFFVRQNIKEQKDAEMFCDKKYNVPSGFFYLEWQDKPNAVLSPKNNIGKRTMELANFMASQGWMLLLCNFGTMYVKAPKGMYANPKREQQIKFTKARAGEKADLPLLMIQFRTIPLDAWGKYVGFIEINGQDCGGVLEKLDSYLKRTMRARPKDRPPYCDILYETDVFNLKEVSSENGHLQSMGKLAGESNFGRYTMRLCDFMVGHVGTWELVVCNGNTTDSTFKIDRELSYAVCAREQQLIFRYRPDGRNVFMAEPGTQGALGRPPLEAPGYWKDDAKAGTVVKNLIPAGAEELAWIQDLLDATYKAKATRDRSVKLADRFVVVNALRSEHPELWEKFAQRRAEVSRNCNERSERAFIEPKTRQASEALASKQSCQRGILTSRIQPHIGHFHPFDILQGGLGGCLGGHNVWAWRISSGVLE
ncbi:unnamed protein product [Effrenium voratum]|nr:unnamed protein product [Effrenium voratum]